MTTVEKLVAEVKAETGTASAELAAIHQLLEDLSKTRRGKVKIDVDSKQVDTATAKTKSLNTQLTGLQGISQKLQGLKLGGQGLTMALGIPAALSAIGPLAAGIDSLAAGVAGLAAPLADASTLMAGLPALATIGAASFGTFKLATMGVGDAIKETTKAAQKLADAKLIGDPKEIEAAQKAYDETAKVISSKLAPAAQTFVREMGSLQTSLKVMGKDLQENLFSGVNIGLQGAIDMLRGIGPELGKIAGAMGDSVASIGTKLGSADFTGKLNTLLQHSTMLFRTFTNVIESGMDVFTNFGLAAQPVLVRVMGSLNRLAASARAWSAIKLFDGSLEDQFDRAYQSLRKLWVILRESGGAIASTLAAFRPLGDWFMDTLGRLTTAWNKWTKSVEGQNTLKKWADESKPVLEELGLLVRDFAKMWADVREPQGMSNLLRTLRTEFLPVLTDILKTANESGLFDRLVASLGALTKIFGQLAGVTSTLTVILDAFLALANAAATLIDAFPLLAQVVANLGTAFTLLKILHIGGPLGMGFAALVVLTDQLFGSLKPLVPVVIAFGAAWAGLKLMSAITQLQQGAALMATMSGQKFGFGAALASQAGVGTQGLGALAAGLSTASIAIGGIAVAVGAGIAVWQAWSTNVKRVKDETEQFTQTLLEGTPAVRALNEQYKEILKSRGGFGDSFRASGVQIGQVTKLVNEHTGDVDKLRGVWHRYNEVVGDKGATTAFRNNLDLIPKSTRPVIEQLLAMVDADKLSNAEMSKVIDGMTDLDQEAAGASAALDGQATAFGKAAKEAGIYADIEAQLNKAKNAGSLEEKQKILGDLAYKYRNVIDMTELSIDTSKAEEAALKKQASAYEKLNKQLDFYYASLGQIASGYDLVKTQDDLKVKLLDVTETLRTNKAAWDDVADAPTRGGQANRDAIRELIDLKFQEGQAILKTEGVNATSVDKAKNGYEELVAKVQEFQGQGLLPADQSAQDLLASLGMLEGTWDAKVQLSIQQEQLMKLQLMEKMLTGIDDKGVVATGAKAIMTGDQAGFQKAYEESLWISEHPQLSQTLTVTEYRKVIEAQTARLQGQADALSGASPGAVYTDGSGRSWVKNATGGWVRQADGGLVDYYARGGMRERHVAQIAPAGAMRVWAEPETGGEAYIPLHPAKRARSISIFKETGRRLGLQGFADGGMTDAEGLDRFYPNAPKSDLYANTTLQLPAGVLREDAPDAAMGGGFSKVLAAFAPGDVNILRAAAGKAGSYKALIQYIQGTGVAARAISTVRPGAIVRGTSRPSFHASARAVDFAPPGGGRDNNGLLAIYQVFNRVRSLLRELIYSGPGGSNPSNPITAADHHDHVHVALAKGGIVTRPTFSLLGESGPEAVIPLSRGGIVNFASGGFSSDDPMGQVAEAMSNAWEALVSKAEETDPNAAIGAIMGRMMAEGMVAWSDEWVTMTQRIERIQEAQAQKLAEAQRLLAEKQAEKTRNKWEWDFEKANAQTRLQMAQTAIVTMEEWTDEWVAMMKRVEEAQAQVNSGGPAVYIAEATFEREADIDALNRSVAWAVSTSRL